MNIVETLTSMWRTLRARLRCDFSDPARLPATGQTGLAVGVRRGRVATLVTHAGTTSRSRWSRARYCDGVAPTISVKRELNEPSDVQPTAKQVSVTDIPWRRWAFARSMRRVIKYE